MITKLRTNSRINPLGIEKKVRFSFVADQGQIFLFKLYNKEKKTVLCEKEVCLDEAIGFGVDYPFQTGVRYFWQIDDSELASFSIAEELDAPFITPKEDITHPVMFTEFKTSNIHSAFLYITGLGFYRAFLNGKKSATII